MLQIGNTLKDLSNLFLLENMLSKIYQIFFLGKYASKEKRSVEYGLIFSEFCCHKGGRIPLTSKLRGLLMSQHQKICNDMNIMIQLCSNKYRILKNIKSVWAASLEESKGFYYKGQVHNNFSLAAAVP